MPVHPRNRLAARIAALTCGGLLIPVPLAFAQVFSGSSTLTFGDPNPQDSGQPGADMTIFVIDGFGPSQSSLVLAGTQFSAPVGAEFAIGSLTWRNELGDAMDFTIPVEFALGAGESEVGATLSLTRGNEETLQITGQTLNVLTDDTLYEIAITGFSEDGGTLVSQITLDDCPIGQNDCPTAEPAIVGQVVRGANIQEGVGQIVTPGSNQESVGLAIGAACPNADPDSQFGRDCRNFLIDGALSTNPDANAQASVAIREITPDQALIPVSAGRNSLRVQAQNVSSRLSALRGGALGVGLRGLSFDVEGQGLLGADLVARGTRPPTGGAAAAGEPLFVLGEGRLGAFVNGRFSSGDKDATTLERGFDFDGWGITLGVDYRFLENLVVGLAGGYAESESDIDGNGGQLDTDAYSISLYGTFFQGDHVYIDGMLSYASNSYDQQRNIGYVIGDYVVDQQASADYDGSQWSGSIGGGYSLSNGPWTYGPSVRLDYASASVDGYTESLSNPNANGGGWGTQLGDLDQDSFTSTIGGDLSRAISTQWGVVLPQLHMSWVHEFEGDAVSINGAFIDAPSNPFAMRTDRPDTDYFNARVGVSTQFAQGRSAFAYYNKVFGYRDFDLDTFGAGVRLEF